MTSEALFHETTRSLSAPYVRVTLVRSYAGKSDVQRRIFRSLGLKKRGATSVLPNVNSVLGQVNKVIQYVTVEPVTAQGESV